ncbi:uncharacterized protein L201_001914 [Kwoniella dendrophila CBS 6074]|uniref:Uncharacterized protein n=1 Tax=Kwoniella dendrophila CBS 6074 TaxID=1295534 RepID=A0AAX4JR49_9TREE
MSLPNVKPLLVGNPLSSEPDDSEKPKKRGGRTPKSPPPLGRTTNLDRSKDPYGPGKRHKKGWKVISRSKSRNRNEEANPVVSQTSSSNGVQATVPSATSSTPTLPGNSPPADEGRQPRTNDEPYTFLPSWLHDNRYVIGKGSSYDHPIDITGDSDDDQSLQSLQAVEPQLHIIKHRKNIGRKDQATPFSSHTPVNQAVVRVPSTTRLHSPRGSVHPISKESREIQSAAQVLLSLKNAPSLSSKAYRAADDTNSHDVSYRQQYDSKVVLNRRKTIAIPKKYWNREITHANSTSNAPPVLVASPNTIIHPRHEQTDPIRSAEAPKDSVNPASRKQNGRKPTGWSPLTSLTSAVPVVASSSDGNGRHDLPQVPGPSNQLSESLKRLSFNRGEYYQYQDHTEDMDTEYEQQERGDTLNPTFDNSWAPSRNDVISYSTPFRRRVDIDDLLKESTKRLKIVSTENQHLKG